MKTDTLRKLYLDFFRSKGHRVFPSDSLIPVGDPSLLFTGAGMNQFKPYFLGLKKDVKRAASCQKCLRTADLDRVGKTAYHHSFFEMLGNFSFGDYFKEEAIAWGWEFVTKELGLPKERLWVSVYEEDDEAFDLWKRKAGLPESRILRMGAIDNFWPSNAKLEGPNGPCGPCSEIYAGETPGKGVEIWNLVFTQFDRQNDGTLMELPQKNIDTGMGLERTAAVLQGKESNFDIDIFSAIRAELKTLLKPGSDHTAEENAVMDHLRAAVFAIGDGAVPSNEGRGYVVRRLVRLGCDHLEKAGALRAGLFHRLVPAVAAVMRSAYPETASKEKDAATIIESEENAYGEILKIQAPRLDGEIRQLREKAAPARLPAEAAQMAFKYYDTYGLPIENITHCLKKNGLALDQDLFDELMEEQKRRSRERSKIAGEIFSKDAWMELVGDLPPTEFLGYENAETEAALLGVLRERVRSSHLRRGEEGFLIFDRSPFYAEAGGQVGDTGEITGENFKAVVTDTQYFEKCIGHRARVEEGEAAVGRVYRLRVDEERRADVMKNHTATHLLHSALRKILGTHVKQSGSLVAPDRLRFDFTHFKAVDSKTLGEVEALVNEEIRKDTALDKRVMSREAAAEEGAIAFFGEKYGDQVRVVTIGRFSKELCGGTHLRSTGQIELFKIVSESSIQAGVRRIEAVTGRRASRLLKEGEKELERLAGAFQTEREGLPLELKKTRDRVAALRGRLVNLTAAKVEAKMEELLGHSPDIRGVKLVSLGAPRLDAELAKRGHEHLKSRAGDFVAFFHSEWEDKFTYVVSVSEGLVQKGLRAGDVVKEIAKEVEGSGGGKPDFAVGGGKNLVYRERLEAVGRKVIEARLGSL
ncbi:MAG: alanine--tRNA ligase [Candidatus Omnitrophica bacterium]|nr:alanine--tRNA ligase [Candidatus Omnitrophota bacterium]